MFYKCSVIVRAAVPNSVLFHMLLFENTGKNNEVHSVTSVIINLNKYNFITSLN